MKVDWLQYVLVNEAPRLALDTAILTNRGEALVITGYHWPARNGLFAYEAADACDSLRYIFDSDIADSFPPPRSEPRLVVDNTRRAA